MVNSITIDLNDVTGRIASPLPDAVIQSIYNMCSFKIQGAEHSALYKKGRWDGSRHLFNIRYNSFSAGLLYRVCDILATFGYTVDLRYKSSVEYKILPPLQIQPIVEPRWYQVAACESAIRAGRSIVKIATGGGKTAVAALIIAQLNVRTLFLVHTKDLLRQARDAIGEYLGRECGQIGDGVVDPRDVTIATIQTISRALGKCYKKDEYSEEDEDDDTDVTNRVDIIRECVDNTTLLMQDEVHRVASKSAFEVSNLVKHAVYHVGFGASPWRDDGADMIIEAAFGCPSFVMTASELIDMGYLMQPTIVFRHIYERLQPRGTYDQIYKDWVVDNPINNGLVVADTRSMLSEGREVMVLVKQIKHGEILKGMLRSEGVQCEFLSGKDGSDVRYRAINDMRSRKLKCLIATTIADEGLDIRPLDGLILAGRGKSSVRALQRVGRTLRPYDKLNPKIIDYYDRVRFLEAHTCRRMQIYATEPKFNLDMSEVNRT